MAISSWLFVVSELSLGVSVVALVMQAMSLAGYELDFGRIARLSWPLPRFSTRTRLLALLFAAIAIFALKTSTAHGAGCPNEQAREQNSSTHLPDCRAYEMVSPLEKNGADISIPTEVAFGRVGVIQSSPNGEKITYHALAAFGTESKGLPIQDQYLSTRTPTGWSTQNITLPQRTGKTINTDLLPNEAFNPSLTEGLVRKGNAIEGEVLEEPAIGGAPAGYINYYLQSFASNTIQALLTTPPPGPPAEFNFASNLRMEGYAATPDLHHVILTSRFTLTPGVNPGKNLFEWAAGELSPVNVGPGVTNGETLAGAVLGSGEGEQDRTVSEDGSRVFFSSPENLYVRTAAGTSQARTIQLDEGIGGSGAFLTASTSGANVFFTTKAISGDLYDYNVDEERLTNLTPTPNPEEVSVQGVLGASEDGTHVYFVARGALAPGATPESCATAEGSTGCNLYLWQEGRPIQFIARLTGADWTDWHEVFADRTSRVSPDGTSATFVSGERLTAYDNSGVNEVYLYKAGSSGLVCVSCNPSGALPTGASSIPGAIAYDKATSGNAALYAPRALSADGNRVFFDSSDGLVTADGNHQPDVYEWERVGTGTCEKAGGCVSLISSGTGSGPSSFLDASESGNDVFFATRQQLAPGDTDQEVDLYDARSDGGYPLSNSPACTGTGCQGIPAPAPIFATPPTGTFDGAGNFSAQPQTPVRHLPPLTRAQKLALALRKCKKERTKHKRAACATRARRSFGRTARRKKGARTSTDWRLSR